MSSTSMRVAEESAVVAIREDPEVREIAKVLPPQKKIKEWVHLSSQEKESLVAAGVDTGMVFKDLVQCVMHVRDLGRTALWDGMLDLFCPLCFEKHGVSMQRMGIGQN